MVNNRIYERQKLWPSFEFNFIAVVLLFTTQLKSHTQVNSFGISSSSSRLQVSSLSSLIRQRQPIVSNTILSSSPNAEPTTSYEVDSEDGSAEQQNAEDYENENKVVNGMINGGTNGDASCNRYEKILDSVGLGSGQLKTISNLPKKRTISPNDVFCNRELKFENINAVGFDMDYTLAQYKQPAFDKLAFDGAKEKLVYDLGYPKEVLDFEYDHTRWSRGLIIDTQRGNFLKIDRHKYVRVAYHGLQLMSSTTRKHIYQKTFNVNEAFKERQFVNMDTLFQLVDAHLFALLIELKDNGEYETLDFKTYEEIYRQVRECVDLCHRDGTIKDEVANNPEKYIILDKGLLPMLQLYKDSGVKCFLLTNSYWEYTSVAMNYLYHEEKVDDEEQKENEWLDLFDIVIVGSCKPAYMVDPYLNLFRVNPADGSLLNTDGLFEIEALGENGAQKFLSKGKVFQGGNWKHLHAMLELNAGEEILYVGDHLYSDVLRSKRTLGWRSAFIVPELEEQMKVYSEQLPTSKKITELRKLRDELCLYAESIKRSRRFECNLVENAEDKVECDEETELLLKQINDDDQKIATTLKSLASEWHKAFHPIWGAMFNAGYQDSRFAFYVANYACLYTSKATNLGLLSSDRSFRTTLEMIPHDSMLADGDAEFVDYDAWDQCEM